jgi:hypothetical protein
LRTDEIDSGTLKNSTPIRMLALGAGSKGELATQLDRLVDDLPDEAF